MKKNSNSTKKSIKNTPEYIMNKHDEEYQKEVMLEARYAQQEEDWRDEQDRPRFNDWSRMNMLDDYAEM